MDTMIVEPYKSNRKTHGLNLSKLLILLFAHLFTENVYYLATLASDYCGGILSSVFCQHLSISYVLCYISIIVKFGI